MGKAVIPLVFFLFGPLAFFAPKAMWLPLLLLLLTGTKAFVSVSSRDYRRLFGRAAPFLIIPVYGFISAFWAIVPGDAVETSGKLLGYFLAASLVLIIVDHLSEVEKKSVFIWAATGFVAADLFVWLDLGTAGAISGLFKQDPFNANFYSRGAALSACALLLLAIGLFRLFEKRLALLFLVTSLATVFVLQNEAAKLAAAFALLAWGAVRWRRAFFWPVIVVPLVIGAVLPSFFANGLSNNLLCTTYNYKHSAAHRFIIYEFTSRKIFEKPFFGWGMDASRSIPGSGGSTEIHDCSRSGQPVTNARIVGFIPLHPHNAFLQVWLELGAAGVALFLAAVAILIWRLQRAPDWRLGRALIAGLFAPVFLVYNISFGLWQSWLIFGLVLVFAIARVLPASGSRTVKFQTPR